jgi:hypothetical protein
VGGLVGLLGALGGFFLPKMFGWLGRSTGFPQAAFLALLVLAVASLVCLHLMVCAMKAGNVKIGATEPMREPLPSRDQVPPGSPVDARKRIDGSSCNPAYEPFNPRVNNSETLRLARDFS